MTTINPEKIAEWRRSAEKQNKPEYAKNTTIPVEDFLALLDELERLQMATNRYREARSTERRVKWAD
jgi:hypothetical protein